MHQLIKQFFFKFETCLFSNLIRILFCRHSGESVSGLSLSIILQTLWRVCIWFVFVYCSVDTLESLWFVYCSVDTLESLYLVCLLFCRHSGESVSGLSIVLQTLWRVSGLSIVLQTELCSLYYSCHISIVIKAIISNFQ